MLLATLSPHIEGTPRHPKIVLIVEDEVLIRMALSEFLRDAGLSVLEAASGDEAIDVLLARGADIDIVFSDVQMPGKADGFALALWVLTNRPEIRMLLTSGVPHAASKAEELRLAAPMMRKPYDHEAVQQQIKLLRGLAEG